MVIIFINIIINIISTTVVKFYSINVGCQRCQDSNTEQESVESRRGSGTPPGLSKQVSKFLIISSHFVTENSPSVYCQTSIQCTYRHIGLILGK